MEGIREIRTQVQQMEITPRESYVIDPGKARADLQRLIAPQSPLQESMGDLSLQAFDLYQKINEEIMRRGELPRTIGVQLSPDVFYKRQWKPNIGDGPSRGTEVEFMSLKNVPMNDWDTPDPRFHPDSSVTVRHLGDVEENIRDYQKLFPESLMRLYQTPGGYRAFELGMQSDPLSYAADAKRMNVDPNYWKINRIEMQANNLVNDPVAFRSRISHKPGRVDWVAQPIATFGSGLPIAHSEKLVKIMHNLPIQRSYLSKGGTSQAMDLLKANLPTASQTLQAELKRRLRL